ncbi:hypothetical protein FS837_003185 [Tulasnella sp. UAMH 9824]|nr:hypothetical protein FS837_003185 [Tulasnella sp. UAMH 9824]
MLKPLSVRGNARLTTSYCSVLEYVAFVWRASYCHPLLHQRLLLSYRPILPGFIAPENTLLLARSSARRSSFMTDSQFPDWMLELSMKDRNKIMRLCEKTVLCIAREARAPLSVNEVLTALKIRRAVVLPDERPGHYWVRSSDNESSTFLRRIRERGLPGYTTGQIDRNGEDWDRLARKLAGRTELEDDTGPSQPGSSIEQQLDIPPNSHPTQLGAAEDLGPGSGEASTSSLRVGGPRSATDSDSSRAPGPSTAGGFDGTQTSTDHVPDRRPPKKRRCKAKVSHKASGSSPTSKLEKKPPPPALDILFRKLSPEVVIYIFELCLEDATSSAEYNAILENLASNDNGPRCLQLLQGNAAFWTRIDSTSPDAHIKNALDLSRPRPLYIEGGPTRNRGVAFNRNKMICFLSWIAPHRDRWASLALLFSSSVLKAVKKHLSGPAPSLETLSLYMADVSPFLSGNSLAEETGLPLDILGGEAGNLERVSFNNIPCLWDPSPFTQIRELGLTNAIQLRFMETITFLRRASNLSALRLVNVMFVGDAPHIVEETILVPCLKELVFVELIERTGLGLLWLSLDAPACSRLELNLRPSEEMVEHPALPSKAAPIVQKALASTDNSFLRFQCNIDTNTQSAIWRSEDVDRPRQGEPGSFDIAFRGLGNGLAGLFCDFVRGVRESVGDVGGIVVNVADSCSGTFDQPVGLELGDLVPTLLPDSFRGLNVVEVRADIVNEHLQLLLDMMVPPEPQIWWLDALRTIHLYAIPKDRLALVPRETAQHSLEDFFQLLSKQHYGIALDLDSPKPSDQPSLSVVLEGEFRIPTTMRQALKKGKKWWGVTVDDTDASFTHGEVQERGSEGVEEVEAEVEAADEYGSD